MGSAVQCKCVRCSIRSLMGPVVVTTVGVLFLLSEIGSGYFHIGHTYPVLFIVIGIVLLASASAPMEGHTDYQALPPRVPPTSSPEAPPPTTYPNSYTGQRQ
jgi:hypothetical protein